MKPELISIREFARRDGCSDMLVRKAIARGHLLASEGGKLNSALVGTGWRKGNRDAGASVANRFAGEPSTFAPDGSAMGQTTLAEAIRRKELAVAQIREMEVERESAKYAPVDEIAAMITAQYAAVRERVNRIPAEVAGRAAESGSASEIQALIASSINRALADLSLA